MAALSAAPAASLGFSGALSSSPLQPALQTAAPAARPLSLAVRSRLRFVRKPAEGQRVVRVNSAGGDDTGASAAGKAPPAAQKVSSILCQSCDGNGAVACSQCHGGGVNTEDHFGGRFKTGQTCWLCRGKRQMLCGNCNGAGFMGGFMNTQDE